VLEHAIAKSSGRWLVGCWDLIENLDTLAQLRGPQEMLIDLLEHPEWVEASMWQINQAYFECYDSIEPLIRDPWGGTTFNAFQLWGLGRTIKVQCDFSCMVSPQMFGRFVVPALAAQCAWADNALYHLDGTQAVQHLDALLAIDSLDGIEWTPQAGIPRGGDPMWYDLYRRIKAAGKIVQAIEVEHDQVLPLIDAVGPEGLYIQATAPDERRAREVLQRTGWRGEC
jgi:5-methyltetrahydrofolate--homocysteine methyltransferase